jgi:FKBP-type peptidyl-prolyl cis-trans isomerase
MKITKYEAVGAFLAVGVMAIALFLFRFDTQVLTQHADTKQTAALTDSQRDLQDRLTNAYAGGELSDLVVQDVRVGTGKKVEKGDTVEVQYEGRLQDGTRFDSSYARGESFTFKVGKGEVIEGWDEGIRGMQEGGERIIVVPPRMGYGDQQYGVIPPKSPLVFMIELIDIK